MVYIIGTSGKRTEQICDIKAILNIKDQEFTAFEENAC